LADLVRNGEAATFKSVKLIVFDDAKQLTQHGMLHNVGLLNDHLPEKGSSPMYVVGLLVEGGSVLTIRAPSLFTDAD
jgi:hypothetical protein